MDTPLYSVSHETSHGESHGQINGENAPMWYPAYSIVHAMGHPTGRTLPVVSYGLFRGVYHWISHGKNAPMGISWLGSGINWDTLILTLCQLSTGYSMGMPWVKTMKTHGKHHMMFCPV